MIGLNQYLVKFTLNSQTLKKIILKNVTVNPTEKKFKLSGTYELRNSATFKKSTTITLSYEEAFSLVRSKVVSAGSDWRKKHQSAHSMLLFFILVFLA